MSSPLVFISYSHSDVEDVECVRKFAQALEEQGVSVWLDVARLLPGDSLQKEIEDAIRKSDAIVVVITPETVRSANLFFEIGAAVGMGKRVIPVLPSDLDTSVLPFSLRSRMYLTRSSPEETATGVAAAVSCEAKQGSP